MSKSRSSEIIKLLEGIHKKEGASLQMAAAHDGLKSAAVFLP